MALDFNITKPRVGGEKSGYLSERLIDNVGMLEMIIREKVKLIQEIPDINAAERVHL